MSRHIVPSTSPQHQIVVGWDRPLNTFFAQVRYLGPEEDDDGDPIVIWVGTNFSHINAPEELQFYIEKYGTISDELLETLKVDRAQGR